MFLKDIGTRLWPPRSVAKVNPFEVAYSIDQFWCDSYGLFIRGWLHCHTLEVLTAHVVVGPDVVPIGPWVERPDVAQAFPAATHALRCGFQAYVACRPGVPVQFRVVTAAGMREIAVELPRSELPPLAANDLFPQFVAAMNRGDKTVLEIGARKAHHASVGYRQHFPAVGRYIGMDIHPSPTVDLVGDAHQLSRLVGEGSMDGIFSGAVMEHLAMPWLIATEINRALRIGGLVYHGVPQAWPVHEQPNDFWRFADEGLKVLFGPTFGFEVIGAAMDTPMRMYPACRDSVFVDLPFFVGYGVSHILARKVADIGRSPDDTVDLGALLQHSEQYPKRDIA